MGSIHSNSDDSERRAEAVSKRDVHVVVRTGRSGYRTEVAADGHALIVDEPESVGGTDTGPNPYRLLAAALGACTSITLRMYADRKEWPLEEIRVDVRHRKVKERISGPAGARTVPVDEFRSRVAIEGDLDEGQRARLMEIALRCPVHRTLDHGARLTTEPWAESEAEVGGTQPPS